MEGELLDFLYVGMAGVGPNMSHEPQAVPATK